MNRDKLIKFYRNKICIIYKENNEQKIVWFNKLSEAQDFQESGAVIVSFVNLKHVNSEKLVLEFLDSLIFDGYDL